MYITSYDKYEKAEDWLLKDTSPFLLSGCKSSSKKKKKKVPFNNCDVHNILKTYAYKENSMYGYVSNFGYSCEAKAKWNEIKHHFSFKKEDILKHYGQDFINRVRAIKDYSEQTSKWDIKNRIEKLGRCFGLYAHGCCETYDSMWTSIALKNNSHKTVVEFTF